MPALILFSYMYQFISLADKRIMIEICLDMLLFLRACIMELSVVLFAVRSFKKRIKQFYLPYSTHV